MILVPPHSLHGFKGKDSGFWAVSIQFNGKALYEDIENPNVVFQPNQTTNKKTNPAAEILAENDSFLEVYKKSRLIKLVTSNVIQEKDVRERVLDCLQIWSDMFQNLLHLRIATTKSHTQKKIALEHLEEELGHNDNLRKQRNSPHRPIWDPVFISSMEWFRQQMIEKDDLAKTLLMHIVLEGSGEIFHSQAAAVFSNIPHFQEHGEDDGGHVSMGIELLNQATPKEVQELRELLAQGWNMITLLCNSIADIAESGRV